MCYRRPMATPTPSARQPGILGLIEWLGNKLPDPIFLFISATVIVMTLSAIGSAAGWQVAPKRPVIVMETVVEAGREVNRPKLDASGKRVIELADAGVPIRPQNLLSVNGIYWLFANMIRNFINFAPLGVVLVAMFGIGVAERVGMFEALMKWAARLVAPPLLTPMMVFLGIMANVASDAGYIVLPPLAAALYHAAKRPPLAGIAAAFCGVAGGFSANLLVGSTDTLIAPITQMGARVLDPTYQVNPMCNWGFLAGSTFLLTGLGWFVTARIVEPRLAARKEDAASPVDENTQVLTPTEARGLRWALASFVPALAVIVYLLAAPGAPLHGPMPAAPPAYGVIPLVPPAAAGEFAPPGGALTSRDPVNGSVVVAPGTNLDVTAKTDDGSTLRGTFRVSEPGTVAGRFVPAPEPPSRWSQAVVPLILFAFLVPGLGFGIATGAIRSPADVSKAFIDSMRTMAPIIAMAFFAAQFVECFKFSRLDAMLANGGGAALFHAGLPTPAMLAGIVVLTMIINILMSSMSAKWTALSVILVPMMMMAGVSPELTQVAYRVGDSCTNIVTPLNSYIVIILATVQKYRKNAGIGDLIALMLPYSVIFAFVWILFLLGWVALGIPLGPSGPLEYTPPLQ